MTGKLRPLPTLAMVVLISLLSAGCSNAPARTSTGTSTSGSSGSNNTATAANREKAVKFAECMRANGVSKFPDPDASGARTIAMGQ